MRVGLVQIDGKLPNLALMQICAYHEQRGDSVEWYDPKQPLLSTTFAKIYASKIFSFSKLPALPDHAIVGGTGIDFSNRLSAEISAQLPSYSLYPDCTYHIGFSMKGCRFRCAFCCVPQKEGRPVHNAYAAELLINPHGGDRLMLLDNDFFGGPDWKLNLESIIDLKLKVCFVQGLNIRILKDEQAEMLAACNYRTSKFNKKRLTFAWDRFQDEKLIVAGIERCKSYGIKTENMQFFVLIGYDTTPEQDLYRVTFLREQGAYPYAMPYNKSDPYQQDFCRWVNHKAIFGSVRWEDYRRGVKKAH